jgi:prepilin-type N-terminal cleavage/methylation domain-containing protein
MKLAMRPPSRNRRTARAHARGYSAVEVLMALTVFGIGAAAVISMQRASVQANLDARKLDTANAIAREWVERLRRDATGWTQPNASNRTGNNFNNAKLLSTYIDGQWHRPTISMGGTPETMSPGFDILGRDLPAGNMTQAVFCVAIRVNWLVPNLPPPAPAGLIRAEVRVIWARDLMNAAPVTGLCDDTAGAADGKDPTWLNTYHAVYTATAIKQNGQ